MGTIKRHPLYERADRIKTAFIMNGFSLYDDGQAPELESSEWDFAPFRSPGQSAKKTMFLEDGQYALRSRAITAQLNRLKSSLPLRAITCGRVYDANDVAHPCHTVIEGVLAARDITLKDYACLWDRIVKEIYGIKSSALLTSVGRDSWQVQAQTGEDSFLFAETGTAVPMAKALLGTDKEDICTWIFSIDADAVAIHDYRLADRDALYSPVVSFLEKYEDERPVMGNGFAARAADILRKRGYLEFSGLKVYEPDCYVKMHMIQESWDKNNRCINLSEPLGPYTGLPTVLTPALEEALAVNYKSGEECVRIFEIGHQFLPDPENCKPKEKISLSVGCYGSGIDKVSFKKEVDSFFTEAGIRNHFFIPTDMAIAYDTKDCWIVLDENMNYLETNFGSINRKALENHGIGADAFMLQVEIAPVEKKAEEEYAFIPPELK